MGVGSVLEMDSLPIPLKYLVAIVIVAYVLFVILSSGHRQRNMPRGPPTLPVIGNAHQIPAHNFYEK